MPIRDKLVREQHACQRYERVTQHEIADGGTATDDEKWALGTLSSATLLLYLPFLENAVQTLGQ